MEASIIIPFTRVEGAKKTINSLIGQITQFSYEIILVGEKKKFFKTLPRIKKVKSASKLFPGEARNLGAKIAKGAYFLFIDDDCLVPDDWLGKNIKFLKTEKKIAAVGGRIRGASPKFFSLCTDYTNFWRQQGNSLRLATQLYTASLGVKKEAFFKVGGFDEKARVGEDVDFINKLNKSGYLSYYNPEIIVFHEHKRDNLEKFLKYMFDNGLFTGLYILKTYEENILIRFFLPIFRRVYFLFILPMAILYTGASFSLNFSSNWKMIFLLPFIFLGYLAYHFGIGVKLLGETFK